MATAVEPIRDVIEPGSRVVFDNVDWDTYEATLAYWDEHGRVRLTYDRGRLELMSPSHEHDEWAQRFGFLIALAATGLRLPFRSFGTATWRKEVKKRGMEADASFYFASVPRMKGKRKLDLNVDPPPELTVEIEISHSDPNRMEIHSALGVPEVWRFDGEDLSVWLLQIDGSYTDVTASPTFPVFSFEEIVHWVKRAEELDDMSEWIVQFQDWVRDVLVPRAQASR